jgi:4,4'-diaponeurosporenoate glycosyltransferase
MELFMFVLMVLGLISGIILFAPLPSKTRYTIKPKSKILTNTQSAPSYPTISVIIPARNEAKRIPSLLTSLLIQTIPILEILVADDGSSDNTVEIARKLGAHVIPCPDKPLGWAGKTWACQTGADHAQGDLLVFLDADVTIQPEGLEALIHQWTNRTGVISVQPFHRIFSWYENLSSFFNLQVIPSLSLGPKTRGLFGPVICISNTDYRLAGGHKAVKRSVLDDVEFGFACRSQKIPLCTFLGGNLFTFRMYPEGFIQMYGGWTKNFLAGAGTTPTLTLFGICFWLIGVGTTGVQAGFHAAGSSLSLLPGPMIIIFYLAYGLTLAISFPLYGNFSLLSALLFPMHLIFYAMVMGRAWILKALGGTVSWRGRAVPLKDHEVRLGFNAQNYHSQSKSHTQNQEPLEPLNNQKAVKTD